MRIIVTNVPITACIQLIVEIPDGTPANEQDDAVRDAIVAQADSLDYEIKAYAPFIDEDILPKWELDAREVMAVPGKRTP
jgi:hypothetical protein